MIQWLKDPNLRRLVREFFELKNEEECEWPDCVEPATYWLICPLCSSRELQCDGHTRATKLAPIGKVVVFNVTCLHKVQLMDCGLERITSLDIWK